MAAIVAAILDLSIKEDISYLDFYITGLVDPQNTYQNTEIINISTLEAEIWLFICDSSHFGGHIG
jgi:hypothetical protein